MNLVKISQIKPSGRLFICKNCGKEFYSYGLHDKLDTTSEMPQDKFVNYDIDRMRKINNIKMSKYITN
jgi:hypothetical protein